MPLEMDLATTQNLDLGPAGYRPIELNIDDTVTTASKSV